MFNLLVDNYKMCMRESLKEDLNNRLAVMVGH